MKISLNWLKDYINIDIDSGKVSELLTNCGLEVEKTEVYQAVKGGLEGIVIGEVLTKTKHPDADKLSLTTVKIGTDAPLNIVCGAPNVEAGQKVFVATIGTKLYKTDAEGKETVLEIKKSKIRGQVSEGMICSEDEIGIGTSHEGIMVLDSSSQAGMTAKEYLDLEDDIIFEIGLTPNRPDAVSHIGVARDLNAVLSINHKPEGNKSGVKVPSVGEFKVDNNSRKIDVIIEDSEACPRYSGLTITGITVSDSPGWLKNRLKAVGLRPINNIVDITNFVMIETGQPLHAFDADKIKGDRVIVKKPERGSRFVTLDAAERELTENDLMICNAEEGMCIAGVFGGINSGIINSTRNIFLESAYFNPRSIRRTSKYHGLSTDSSFRFERGADPNITVYALKRAAILIKQIAGGNISSEITDVYPYPIENTFIKISYSNIDKTIGKRIEREQIKNIIKNLWIAILKESDDILEVSVPPFKSDVKREIDIIEEILRIYGYNNVGIPEEIKFSLNYSVKPDKENLQNKISDYLSYNGFYELYCNSLTKSAYSEAFSNLFRTEENVKILHPISRDLNVMRQSMLFGGLETIAYNNNRKQQDLKLYEFGFTYKKLNVKCDKTNLPYEETSHLSLLISGRLTNETWKTKEENTDIFYLKYYVNNILKHAGISLKSFSEKSFSDEIFSTGLCYEHQDGKELLRMGLVDSKALQMFDIKKEVYFADILWEKLLELSSFEVTKYKELPKYPEVRRDIALLLDKGKKYSEIEKLAYATEKKLLKEVSLFDIYEGEKIEPGKKSYAISLLLQDDDKTLTDKEVDRVVEKIKTSLIQELGAIIR